MRVTIAWARCAPVPFLPERVWLEPHDVQRIVEFAFEPAAIKSAPSIPADERCQARAKPTRHLLQHCVEWFACIDCYL